MALYTIARKCGHEEEIQIYGTNVNGQRERRAAWEAGRDCWNCVKAARQAQQAELNARAAEVAKAAGWPELTGSPKQVAWAQDIRATAIAALAGHITDERILAVIISAALRQTDAGWWIDRRGLVKPIRNRMDLVNEPGAARYSYGSLIEAVAETLTEDEREQLRTESEAADEDPPATPQAAIGALRAAGWTVAKIAAEVGAHPSTVYRWATGAQTPNARNSAALAQIRS